MAWVERFELPNDGVRVRSLTAWRYPIIAQLVKVQFSRTLSRYPYSIHAYSSFCKCFEAISCNSAIFFVPSTKLKYIATVS